MTQKLALILILLNLFIGQTALAQTSKETDSTKKDEKSPVSDEVRGKAVDMLRETAKDVMTLNSFGNRINFQIEIAALLWKFDEKEARAAFRNTMADWRNFATQAESKKRAEQLEEDAESNRKSYSEIMQLAYLRRQLVTSLAECDAQMALEFLRESRALVSSLSSGEYNEARDDSELETRITTIIAQTDVTHALELARAQLAKGLSYNLIELLGQIYQKDNDKGRKFAGEIVDKLKNTNLNTENSSWNVAQTLFETSLAQLEKTTKEKSDKKPFLDDTQLKELADLLIKNALQAPATDTSLSWRIQSLIDNLGKYAPAEVPKLRRKFGLDTPQYLAVETQRNKDRQSALKSIAEARAKEEQEKKKTETEKEQLNQISENKLTEEERKKAVADARQQVLAVKQKDAKMLKMIQLATSIAASGDKETALDLMREAQNWTTPQPKTAKDCIEHWILATGYAKIEPKDAFPILENVIVQLNDVISALARLGDFISEGELTNDGELSFAGFGNIGRELLQGGGKIGGEMTELIQKLAEADFDRTKGLADKFDKPEMRLTARLLIIKSLLSNKTD
jgi:hypothetical protein